MGVAQIMGISKKELLVEYYFDEFLLVSDQYFKLKNPQPKAEDEVSPEEFTSDILMMLG